MILKSDGVDPRGLARLNQLVRSSVNQFAYMSCEPSSRDARVIVPKKVTENFVRIVSSKADSDKNASSVTMSVVIEVKPQFVIYLFLGSFEDIGASVRQERFERKVLLIPRAVVDAVLDCLGVFPAGKEDISFYWDNVGDLADRDRINLDRIRFFLEKAHKLVHTKNEEIK